MTEQQPQSEPDVDTYLLGGQSLAEWHTYLTTDKPTGEVTGHLTAPGSRCGRDGYETAWRAIAAQAAYSYASGSDNTPDSFDYFMMLAVNDDDSVGRLLVEFLEVLPPGLVDQIGRSKLTIKSIFHWHRPVPIRNGGMARPCGRCAAAGRRCMR
jgi:hypothetical protein